MNLKDSEKEFSIQAPWGKIAGVTWGDPSLPPVLLVHGKLDVCTGFRPLVSLLPRSFYYVAIDLPGNGRSDHLPPGVRFTVFDMVPTIAVVKEAFGWKRFIYMGHSLGALISKLYNIAYPGVISRVVELDPVPAHHTWETTREDLRRWYHAYYGSYQPDRYHKFYGGPETAPTYTYEKSHHTREDLRRWYHAYYGSYQPDRYHKFYGGPETAPTYTYEKSHHTREDLRRWYHAYYGSYQPDRYHKFYGGPETAPTYTYEKAQEMMMNSRNMTKEATENVLERCLVTVGDGLYRFSYDQRMKEVTVLPFSGELLRLIYTPATTPTFAVIAQKMIDKGNYTASPFVTNERYWLNNNYKFKIVDGGHDVHIYNPECMAEDVAKFLMEHFKSKL